MNDAAQTTECSECQVQMWRTLGNQMNRDQNKELQHDLELQSDSLVVDVFILCNTETYICSFYIPPKIYIFVVTVHIRNSSAFSVAGPTLWNSLPDHLSDPAVDSEQFRWDLKTYLFAGHSIR